MNSYGVHLLHVFAMSLMLLVCSDNGQAQDLPATQLWLAQLINEQPELIKSLTTADRYHNQPHFSPDSRILYFTAEQADGQTDIATYQIETGETHLLLSSPESEYSPTPIPGDNAVSVIRVEPPDNVQRLWRIPLNQDGPGVLMPNVEPVGYHSWVDQNTVAVFVLGESFSLQRAHIGDQLPEFLYDNIGRTLRTHPLSGAILFVDKNLEPWRISALHIDGMLYDSVLSLFPEGEDFEVDPSGRFWTGLGSKLYRSDIATSQWRLVADLTSHGIRNISRLAISPDGKFLAMVSSP